MKGKKSFALVALLMSLVFVACEEDKKNAYAPEFSGFSFEREGELISPSSLRGGDSIVITAVQAKKGKYIYRTYYNWTFNCVVARADGSSVDSTMTYSYNVSYDGDKNGNANPSYTLVLPDNVQGRASVKFEAKYNYYADGLYYGGAKAEKGDEPLYGTITSSSGILSGGAQGTHSFMIK